MAIGELERRDVLVFHSLVAIANSANNLYAMVLDAKRGGYDLASATEEFDTTTVLGEVIFTTIPLFYAWGKRLTTTHFSTRRYMWIKFSIERYKFQENKDFVLISATTEIKKSRSGDRRSKDYHITLNIATLLPGGMLTWVWWFGFDKQQNNRL